MIATNFTKVVYWLGAGASCQALPIVGEMPNAFRNQPYWVLNVYPKAQGAPWFNRYREQMGKYAVAAEKYGTIDTYARSLFLLKKHDELADLKLHLSMYFLIEQAVETKTYRQGNQPPNEYSKPDQIDKRYMTWLAQVLDNDAVIHPRVRIISWNYDLQVEHAIGLYHGLSNLSKVHEAERFGVYPALEHSDDKPMDKPALIHLNGIAGQAVINNSTKALYDELISGNPEDYLKHLFERYDGYNTRERTMLHAMSDTFNFAWEDNKKSKTGIELAKKSFQNARVLVIIGYSFPAFNRTIDMALVKSFIDETKSSRSGRIHIQSPNMTAENFRHLFGITSSTHPAISTDSDVTQFYLPPELFS